MRRLSLVVLPLGLFVVGLFVVGLAASLSETSNTLGAATQATPRCANGSLGVVPDLSGSNIVSVTIGNIPATCGNGTLLVTVNNGTVNSSGSAAVPASGGSLTVSLASAIAMTAAVETDMVFVGP